MKLPIFAGRAYSVNRTGMFSTHTFAVIETTQPKLRGITVTEEANV